MARLDSFLRMVFDQHGSDLHFHAGSTPIIRYMGDLVPLPYRSLSPEETQRFLYEIMNDEQIATLHSEQETDFAYVVPGLGRFRVNVFTQSRGLGAVFRVIAEEPPTIDQLKLPPVVRRLAMQQNGLLLVTGPTGSGKTTTLAAIIKEINNTMRRHIITIEDPIEYIHEPNLSVITQRELGTHTNSAISALRAALREAPDVLVVGELRDFETINLALSAAETGVLVLGTLHTNSAAKAVDRLISACPEDQMSQIVGVLSVMLKGVIAQHLCKIATGDGRVAVIEVLLQSYAVSNLIRENKIYQIDSYLQSSEHAGTGMQSLDKAILDFIRDNTIRMDDGLAIANDPNALRQAMDNMIAAEQGHVVG
ncbi:MAG TPA: PilT/PilU family type 4a pilus ATPase [Polyangiaceae bacterium]|jgi:twitching motility protein PilT|nr:PilT/PilU family type 4a pilus ATPase [Polyangiaceae bacterium]